jgi:hypothetical protein
MRRNPIRSEGDAFRLTIALAALVAVAGFIGSLTGPAEGVATFAALALAGLAAYLRAPESGRPRPLRTAARGPHPHAPPAGTRRVLVVANAPLEGEELRGRLRDGEGARVELDVLAPVLSSRVHLAYTDIDHEMRQARERLQRSLEWARAQGFKARGEIGDANPLTAIEDELRDFGADEVIVVTREQQDAGWQEEKELESLYQELDVPVARVAGPTRA